MVCRSSLQLHRSAHPGLCKSISSPCRIDVSRHWTANCISAAMCSRSRLSSYGSPGRRRARAYVVLQALCLTMLSSGLARALPIDAGDEGFAALAASAADPAAGPAVGPAADAAHTAAALAIADGVIHKPSGTEGRVLEMALPLELKPPAAGLGFSRPALGVEPLTVPLSTVPQNRKDPREPTGGQAAPQIPARVDAASALDGVVGGQPRAAGSADAWRSHPAYRFVRDHRSVVVVLGVVALAAAGGLALTLCRQPEAPRRRRRHPASASGLSASASSSHARSASGSSAASASHPSRRRPGDHRR